MSPTLLSIRVLDQLRWMGAMLALIGLLTLSVQAGGPPLIDQAVLATGLRADVLHELEAVFAAITTLGSTHVALWLTAGGGIALAAGGLWRAALALALAVAATQLVVDLIKDAVARPRPALNEIGSDAAGPSFPSGHSATSAALFGVLALVAVRYARGTAGRVVAVVAALVVVLVGTTRVALSAHYPTDVLAGWLTGAVVALTAWGLVHLRRARRAAR